MRKDWPRDISLQMEFRNFNYNHFSKYNKWHDDRHLSIAVKFKSKEFKKTDGNMELLLRPKRTTTSILWSKKEKKNIIFFFGVLQPCEKNRRRHNFFPVFLIIEIDHIPHPPLPYLFAKISSLLIFPYVLFPFFHSIRKEVCRCYCSCNIVASGFLRGFHRKWWDSY